MQFTPPPLKFKDPVRVKATGREGIVAAVFTDPDWIQVGFGDIVLTKAPDDLEYAGPYRFGEAVEFQPVPDGEWEAGFLIGQCDSTPAAKWSVACPAYFDKPAPGECYPGEIWVPDDRIRRPSSPSPHVTENCGFCGVPTGEPVTSPSPHVATGSPVCDACSRRLDPPPPSDPPLYFRVGDEVETHPFGPDQDRWVSGRIHRVMDHAYRVIVDEAPEAPAGYLRKPSEVRVSPKTFKVGDRVEIKTECVGVWHPGRVSEVDTKDTARPFRVVTPHCSWLWPKLDCIRRDLNAK